MSKANAASDQPRMLSRISFRSIRATPRYTTVGILSGYYSGKVITQALTVSINKAIDFW